MSNSDDCVSGSDQTLVIPSGHFVYRCDFDADEPYLTIVKDGDFVETKVPVPRALAYYLRTHSCGSHNMRTIIEEHAKRQTLRHIKEALGLER
jgi:hypothetical protein